MMNIAIDEHWLESLQQIILAFTSLCTFPELPSPAYDDQRETRGS